MKSLQELINKHGDQEIEESKFKELFGIKTEWKPELNEPYWYATNGGEVFDSVWGSFPIDRKRWEFGNVYQTEAEAQFANDKKRFLVTMERDFKDNSDPIDWSNTNQKKYFIEYRHWDNVLYRGYLLQNDHATFTTTNRDWLDCFIIDEEADIKKYLFGVEE